MRILTVRQPWAWAIIHGGKDVENRTRNIAGSYRGPVLIHASKAIDFGAADDLTMRMAWHEAFLPERLIDGGFTEPILRESPDEDASWMPTGAIIGVVDLVDVHHEHPAKSRSLEGAPVCFDNHTPAGRTCSVWGETFPAPGGFHMVFANPRALDEPIPYKGGLGLRRTDFEVVNEYLVAPWGHGPGSCTPYGCEPWCEYEPVAKLTAVRS